MDDVLVTKTSASLRIPDDYIIRIPISKTGKTLKLQWPKVSVSVATLEVVYNEGKTINKIFFYLTLYELSLVDNSNLKVIFFVFCRIIMHFIVSVSYLLNNF